MDLINFLQLIFPNKLPDECENMTDNLKNLGLICVKDLKYLDEYAISDLTDFTRYEAKKLIDWITNPDPENFDLLLMKIFEDISYDRFQETKVHLNGLQIKNRNDFLNITENQLNNGFFSEAEIKKIERFLELNSGKLEHTLRKIFSGTSRVRLKRIYEILKDQEVYSGNDISFVNTTELRKNGSFSESEILKIEHYLKENNKERYDEIRENRKNEGKIKLLEFESNLKIKEQRHQCLVEEKLMLLKEVSDLKMKSVEVKECVSEDSARLTIFGFNVAAYESRTRRQKLVYEGNSREVLMKTIQKGMECLKVVDEKLDQIMAIQLNTTSNKAIQ